MYAKTASRYSRDAVVFLDSCLAFIRTVGPLLLEVGRWLGGAREADKGVTRGLGKNFSAEKIREYPCNLVRPL